MGDINLKAGTLLVADAAMADAGLQRSVILILKHDKDGTVGVNIAGVPLKQGAPFCYGGDSERETLRFIYPGKPGEKSPFIGDTGYAVQEMLAESKEGRAKASFLIRAALKGSVFLVGAESWVPGELRAETMEWERWRETVLGLKDFLAKPADARWALAQVPAPAAGRKTLPSFDLN